jgi:septal ring factor EnvC (AmiA/AmiB activator)
MGFFNKKELAEIERLKEDLRIRDFNLKEFKERLSVIVEKNKKLEELLKASEELTKSNKELREENTNLNKIILEKEEDLEDLGDVLIAEQSDLKRLKKDVTTLGNTLKSATNELNDSTELIIKYKQALTEIAEYDFDRHKKAYLLNDFFQQRAKKALAEDE